MLRSTPFHPRTAPLVRAQTWRRWAGYQVASAYDPHPDREYAAIRSGAALIDVSPLHKYRISGRDAERMLDRMVTRDMTRSAVGQVYYSTWCDARGKVVDDGTIQRLGEHRFLLTAADPNVRWLTLNAAGMDVTLEDVSERTAALALQGPLSRAILSELCPDDLSRLRYFRLIETTLRGVPVTISRTGYTGDLGYELWVDAGRAVSVWDTLMEAGAAYGITPCGVWAMDTARIEAGLMMLEVDYHSAHHAVIEAQTSTPLELSLGWTVSPSKGPFTGRGALRAEGRRGPAWRFVGVAVQWDSLERLFRRHGLPPSLPSIAWRTSLPLYRWHEQVGYASSGCWSPLLKELIALAHVRAPHADVGTEVQLEVTVEHRRELADAVIRPLPFFDPPRKKA